jgi:anti-sigma B factor antagonist
MSLTVVARRLGDVVVLRCEGRIVCGAEAATLEENLNRLSREWCAFVLDLAGIAHLDSTGLGLLVRCLSRTRAAGGDLKLAAPTPHIRKLLELTKLAAVFDVYDAEQPAVAAFFRAPARARTSALGQPARRVLFIHRSLDVCAFARTLLSSHGFAVSSTDNLPDAKVLLKAGKVDVVIVGPTSVVQPHDKTAAALAAIAPQATILRLGMEFESMDAGDAGRALLALAA